MKTLAIVLVLTASGCGGIASSTNPNVTGNINAASVANILQEASFDFGCPAEEIYLQAMRARGRIGVTGCGKRAIYQWVGDVGSTYARQGEVIVDAPAPAPAVTSVPEQGEPEVEPEAAAPVEPSGDQV